MSKRLTLLSSLLCACGVLLGPPSSLGGEKQASNVKKLVDESIKKQTAMDCGLFIANPLLETDVPEALAYIRKHPDGTSYHLLFALRKYYPSSYESVPNQEKSAILCGALKHTVGLNDWGILSPSGSFDRESAQALLETGKTALECLAPILDDDSPAPLFGSKVATTSKVYRYRRKDFAYRYASLLIGKSPVFDRDPKERDKDIDRLKAELKKHAK
jgi:hypothetical protein